MPFLGLAVPIVPHIPIFSAIPGVQLYPQVHLALSWLCLPHPGVQLRVKPQHSREGGQRFQLLKCPQMFEIGPGIRSVERRARRGSGGVSSSAPSQLLAFAELISGVIYYQGLCLCHPRRHCQAASTAPPSISCPSGVQSLTLLGWKRP